MCSVLTVTGRYVRQKEQYLCVPLIRIRFCGFPSELSWKYEKKCLLRILCDLQNYRGRIFFGRILPKSTQKKSYLDNFAVSPYYRIYRISFYPSDAARTKYLTWYLASFSISTELALSKWNELCRVESSVYLSSVSPSLREYRTVITTERLPGSTL